MPHYRKKNGFTLVELSIVLVIIGLLIGGILVGQSLMSSVKITNQVRQFQQYDIITTNFKQKFGGLPGDNRAFQLSLNVNPTGVFGNKDGIIDNNANLHDYSEFCNFWFQLSYSNMLKDNHSYVIVQHSDFVFGTNLPYAVITSDPNTSKANRGVLVYGIPVTGKNYYELTAGSNSWVYSGGRSIYAKDMMPLDAKMDDGNGNTGIVIARQRNTSMQSTNTATDAGDTACVNADGTYKVNGSTYECLPRIEMFSQNGGGLK